MKDKGEDSLARMDGSVIDEEHVLQAHDAVPHTTQSVANATSYAERDKTVSRTITLPKRASITRSTPF